MNEKPIERLNYYNGQRLQAADFKLEQDYHMRVRRWLNRSLYTAGIASGLEVRVVKGAPRVRIAPGLALDGLGREIILLDEREEVVPGAHDEKNRPIDLYLTISYAEEVLARQDACCTLAAGSGEKAAWGGPSRVLAEPVLEWSDRLPHESSGKVLLARVGLGKGCKEVNLLDTGVRRYVGAASAAKVRQYALEGFRDIDENNLGVIRFHIRGRQPSAITLFLRSESFPSYFYTELGKHQHSVSVNFEPHTVPTHDHGLAGISSSEDGGHSHRFRANTGNWFPGFLDTGPRGDAFGITFRDGDPNGDPNGSGGVWQRHTMTLLSEGGFSLGQIVAIDEGSHHHGFAAGTVTGSVPAVTLNHVKTAASSPNTGETGVDTPARNGDPITYIEDLRIEIDGRSLTASILTQIRNFSGATWSMLGLGTGSAADLLAETGSGPIKLDYLMQLDEGEHVITFSVPGLKANGKANGGRIHYNLYVE